MIYLLYRDISNHLYSLKLSEYFKISDYIKFIKKFQKKSSNKFVLNIYFKKRFILFEYRTAR